MNGTDFLNLAIQLAQSSDEARLRTAISRAYYGAFHLAADLLADFGIHIPASDKSHTKIPFCLLHSGCDAAEAAAKLLEDLRRSRNLADYDLRNRQFDSRASVLEKVLAVQRFDDLIARCRVEPEATVAREGVRRYARDVLRLTIAE